MIERSGEGDGEDGYRGDGSEVRLYEGAGWQEFNGNGEGSGLGTLMGNGVTCGTLTNDADA